MGPSQQNKEGLLDVTEENKEEFLMDMMDFKVSMMTKMGNLTCVLTQLNMINADYYRTEEVMKGMRNSLAGQDEDFVTKMADNFSDCYDLSRVWPQNSLDRHPMTMNHRRKMIFF